MFYEIGIVLNFVRGVILLKLLHICFQCLNVHYVKKKDGNVGVKFVHSESVFKVVGINYVYLKILTITFW